MKKEMRTDVELLIALCDGGPAVVDRRTGRPLTINAKALSLWSGLSVQTISDYKTGKYNIPISFWRSVLEHHADPRVIALAMPDDMTAHEISVALAVVPSAPEFFRESVKACQAYYTQQQYLADILADGRVDELDAASVQKFSDAFRDHQRREASLHAAIVGTFEFTRARKAGVS